MRFYSDNTATICPELLEAIRSANQGLEKAYGDDPWTMRLDQVFGEFFARPVRAYAVATGTAANALALATLSPPYGAIFAHEEAHIARDECGAPEFFSGGARLALVCGAHGKLTANALAGALDANPVSVHTVQPAAVSLTQASELGTVYRPEEIAAIAAIAHARGLRVHVDGARIANALAFLGCHPSEVTWRAGVDVLSFGATKNGALAAEAVVFFDPARAADFELRRKRAGHLLSKSRFVAAQLIAYLESGVWLRNATRANALAQRIARAAGARLLHPTEANEVFLHLGADGKARLRSAGFAFYDWGAEASGEARFVASWDQPEESVSALCEALARL
ncbi:MAG TPA: beta-eliminating lyase-related protein [Steroidobacteraceae bacterium]|nr:beta-eliminating lyase-related protein [Steroidobacteraceae bacterium]